MNSVGASAKGSCAALGPGSLRRPKCLVLKLLQLGVCSAVLAL